MAFYFHVDPRGWPRDEKRAWLENLPRLQAIELLRNGDLQGMPIKKIRSLATLAFDDHRKAHDWAMNFYRERLAAGMQVD